MSWVPALHQYPGGERVPGQLLTQLKSKVRPGAYGLLQLCMRLSTYLALHLRIHLLSSQTTPSMELGSGDTVKMDRNLTSRSKWSKSQTKEMGVEDK